MKKKIYVFLVAGLILSMAATGCTRQKSKFSMRDNQNTEERMKDQKFADMADKDTDDTEEDSGDKTEEETTEMTTEATTQATTQATTEATTEAETEAQTEQPSTEQQVAPSDITVGDEPDDSSDDPGAGISVGGGDGDGGNGDGGQGGSGTGGSGGKGSGGKGIGGDDDQPGQVEIIGIDEVE